MGRKSHLILGLGQAVGICAMQRPEDVLDTDQFGRLGAGLRVPAFFWLDRADGDREVPALHSTSRDMRDQGLA